MLNKKIENNKSKLNMVNEETKLMIENIIVEDKIRINELEHELNSRRGMGILTIVLLLILAIFFLFLEQYV